jgi:hypothetical protein
MARDREVGDATILPGAWLPAALGFFALAGIAEVAWRPMNGDASWYVYIAGRYLDGDRPYVDLVDTNPPLILWLNMAVVAVARAIHVPPLVAFGAFAFIIVGLSLGLAWLAGGGLPASLRRASLAAFGYMLLVGVGSAFGQREHLMTALVLPYAYAASAAARGERTPRGLAIAVGLLAGVGFALKPFFVLAAAAVELFLAARRGLRVWLRPEALAMAGVGLAYAVALITLAPEYFDVARRFAPLYPAHNPMGSTLVANSWRLGIVAAGVGLAWGACRKRAPGWAEVFGLLDLWLTAAVYLTGKGWDYHWFPPLALSWSIGLCAVALMLATTPVPKRRLIALASVGLVLAPTTLSLQETASRRRDFDTARLVREGTHPGDAVFVLSPWIHKAFPMVMEAGVVWGSRHPMLWQVAAFYPDECWKPGQYHSPAAMPGAEKRFFGEVVADFLQSRPSLLLIDDDPPRPLLAGFRYLDYFALDPAFARAMKEYEFVARTPSFAVYRRRTTSDGLVGSPFADNLRSPSIELGPRLRTLLTRGPSSRRSRTCG